MGKDVGTTAVRIVRDADRDLTAAVDTIREGAAHQGDESADVQESDEELAHFLSTLRMVKDPWEIGQMRDAIEATANGFDAVVADSARRPCVAAAANAGSRVSSVCTRATRATASDMTRSVPPETTPTHCTGSRTPVRLPAATCCCSTRGSRWTHCSLPTSPVPCRPAAASATRSERSTTPSTPPRKPGLPRSAGREVLRRPRCRDPGHCRAPVRLGLLPEGIDVEATLDKEHGHFHRRWMVHGTSHHLGMDVHDCALASRQEYMGAELTPGMILTVEPGSTSRPMTSWCPLSCAHRGCASRTTSWSLERRREPLRSHGPAPPATSRPGSPASKRAECAAPLHPFKSQGSAAAGQWGTRAPVTSQVCPGDRHFGARVLTFGGWKRVVAPEAGHQRWKTFLIEARPQTRPRHL